MHSTVGKRLFGHKYQLSSDQFKEGIKRIDKVTKDLEKAIIETCKKLSGQSDDA